MKMTYDTVTASTDAILVRNGTNSESNNPESSISPATIIQKHDPVSSSTLAVDQQSTHVMNGQDASNTLPRPTSPVAPPPSPASSSKPSGSTSSSQSDTDDMKKGRKNSLNENNNIIGLTAGTDETSSNASQTSTELTSSDYSPSKGDRSKAEEKPAICYNPILDDEIRNRLDKLNALSDLINSLENQFDQTNMLFNEILKCSTDRLSTIAKTLGSKSIRYGRTYHQAKISVEQTQLDCQRACVQFEQANNDHQFAKEAIREAELRLKQMNIDTRVKSMMRFSSGARNSSFEFNDLGKLSLDDDEDDNYDDDYHNDLKQESSEYSKVSCDNQETDKSFNPAAGVSVDSIDASHGDDATCLSTTSRSSGEHVAQEEQDIHCHVIGNHDATKIMNAAKLSEDLNQAIHRLFEAEQKRRQSEKMHLDQANKLMIAQENLLKLEREHGTSIKRSQIYFDEAKRFNVRLNSVKADIARISTEIIAAKQAYAKALNELEQFSEDLHLSSNSLSSSNDPPVPSQTSNLQDGHGPSVASITTDPSQNDPSSPPSSVASNQVVQGELVLRPNQVIAGSARDEAEK